MTGAVRVVAIDLGASSGRVHVAAVGPGQLRLEEIGRFPNGGIQLGATLHWDVLGLLRGVLTGLADAARAGPLHSVGVDSWAVDYGLLRADGSLLGNPVHYRDPRTAEAVARISQRVGAGELFARTGIAQQPFNTLYQLAADRDSGHLEGAATVLLIPDLFGYWLSGQRRTELTNASTTQLLGVSGEWDPMLLDEAGAGAQMWGALVQPGDQVGELTGRVATEAGLPGGTVVTAVASHDTASAVLAVPAADEHFAYLSCGTWSLVGLELPEPVLSEQARLAGFTNERGLEGTTRFLRNVMGLWLLQECVRSWQRGGMDVQLDPLLAAAEDAPACRWLFDVDHSDLLTPGEMPQRIALACHRAGHPVPAGPVELTRAILDSLAMAYRAALREAQRLTGRTVSVLHLVGGGVHNALLCQLTADACGLPVLAGPVEAAALGNVLVQARALGSLSGDRWSLRERAASYGALHRYVPSPAGARAFDQAAVLV